MLSANKLMPFTSQLLPDDGSDIKAKILINNSEVKSLYFALLKIIPFLLFSPSGCQITLLFVTSAKYRTMEGFGLEGNLETIQF